MNISFLGFMLIIVAVGGAIAYFGDHVGRTIGKKKLRLRGLRPKHVASIGTIVLGVLVSVVSISLVMFFSHDLRTILLRGNQIIADKESAEKSLHSIEIQRGSLEKEIGGLKTQISDQKKSLVSNARDLKLSSAELTAKQAAMQGLQKSLSAMRREVVGFRQRVSAQQAKFTAVTTQLETKAGQLKRVSSDLQAVSLDLAKAQQDLREAKRLTETAVAKSNEADQKNLELVQTNAKLEGQQERLANDVTRLQGEQISLTKERETAKADLTKVSDQLKDANGKLADVQVQLQRLEVITAAYESISANSRTQPEIFSAGEEVSRLVIQPAMSYAAASSAVTTLLRSARIVAEERGAKATARYQAADIIERADPKTRQSISAADEVRRVVRLLVGSRDRQVLMAFSSVNTFKGEPVSLDLVAVPDPLVYRKGTVIAETGVDATMSDSAIYEAIYNFMLNRVRPKMIRDRMIPKSGTDQSFGELSPKRIFDLIKEIRDTDRVVRLQVLADDDIHAADALKITFRIR